MWFIVWMGAMAIDVISVYVLCGGLVIKSAKKGDLRGGLWRAWKISTLSGFLAACGTFVALDGIVANVGAIAIIMWLLIVSLFAVVIPSRMALAELGN